MGAENSLWSIYNYAVACKLDVHFQPIFPFWWFLIIIFDSIVIKEFINFSFTTKDIP